MLVVSALMAGMYGFAGYNLVCWAGVDRLWGYLAETQADQFVYITSVVPDTPVTPKLQPGDKLIGFDHHLDSRPEYLGTMLWSILPGQCYILNLQRGGQRVDASLCMGSRRSLDSVPWKIPPLFVTSFFCFAVAVLLWFLKPGDPTAQLGGLTFLLIASQDLGRCLEPIYWMLGDAARAMFALLIAADPLMAVAGIAFASRFPVRIEQTRMWRAGSILLGAVAVAEWLRRAPNLALVGMPHRFRADAYLAHRTLLDGLNAMPVEVWKVASILILVFVIALVVRNHRLSPDQDMRRRMRWVIAAIAAAIASDVVLTGLALVSSAIGGPLRPGTALFANAEIALHCAVYTLLASALAYAVLKHRILGVELIVHAGVRYFLARRVLQALLALPVLILALRVIRNPELKVSELVYGSHWYLAAWMAAGLGLRYRRSVLAWLDRRFFREVYSRDRILRDLVQELQNRDSVSDVTAVAAGRIHSALHPERVLVFHRNGEADDFEITHSSLDGLEGLRIASDSDLLRVLESGAAPRAIALEEVREVPERDLLHDLGAELLVPIGTPSSPVLGILLMGPKKSEEPYTAEDRLLLEAVAAQIGMLFENARLRENARKEMVTRTTVLSRMEGSGIHLLQECPLCGACADSTASHCSEDGAELKLSLPVERVIAGHFRLDRRIGKGGMGAVYRATDMRLRREVAMKIMLGGQFGSDTAIRRYEREARAAARLNHPNIVDIYDFGEVGEGAYLVMELLDGRTLRWQLNECGLLDAALAAEWFDQILDGLEAAHAAGIVHRDLKPENVMITRPQARDLLKILDFGLARIRSDAETDTLTAAGTILGTLGYMSPEQLLGQDATDRSDVFSVSVMAAEVVTGVRPFRGKTVPEFLSAIANPSLQAALEGPGASHLHAILLRGLSVDPLQRPTVAELRAELIPALRRPPLHRAAPVVAENASTIDTRRHAS